MTRARWLRLILVLALVGGIALVVGLRGHLEVAELESTVRGLGAWAPLGFVALYAAAVVLFAPGSVLTLAGGALFGPVWGTLWNLTGATVGAAIAFLIARYLGADWVARRAGPRLSKLEAGVRGEGWRFIAFVRLVPVFPFNVLNYALGLTRIPFVAYVLATWLFMLPGAVAYTWLGYAGREALGGSNGTVRNILIALALLASVAFLPRFVRKLKEKPMLAVDSLKQQLDIGADVLLLDVRPAADFTGEQGHIASARNVPLEDLPANLAELEEYKTRPLRLVCRTDRRSAQAARLLQDAGFTDARIIEGGMTAWRARGWPVIEGTNDFVVTRAPPRAG